MRPHNACAGCIHWRGANSGKDEMKFCHFMLDTLKMRGGDPKDCTHWTNAKKIIKRKDVGL